MQDADDVFNWHGSCVASIKTPFIVSNWKEFPFRNRICHITFQLWQWAILAVSKHHRPEILAIYKQTTILSQCDLISVASHGCHPFDQAGIRPGDIIPCEAVPLLQLCRLKQHNIVSAQ